MPHTAIFQRAQLWDRIFQPAHSNANQDIYIFHKRQLKEDFGHLYAKLGFTIQASPECRTDVFLGGI